VPTKQIPYCLDVDSTLAESRVEAAPAAAMGRSEAQVRWRRNHPRCEEGIAELEERVGPAVEATVERVSESAQGVERFHDNTF